MAPQGGSKVQPFEYWATRIGLSEVITAEASQWHPFSGEAVAGPLKGRKLTQVASVVERWDVWLKKHPDTDVVLGSLQMRSRPHGMSHGSSIGHPHLRDFFGQIANLNQHVHRTLRELRAVQA